MQREGRDHIEVALRDVRARVTDLLGQEAAFEAGERLTRRAGVQPDGRRVAGRAEPSKETQERGLTKGLEREPDPVAQTRSAEGALQGACDFGHALQVVHVERRAVLAGERLSVASRDEQAPAGDAHAGVFPGA